MFDDYLEYWQICEPTLSMVNKYIVIGLENTILSIVMSLTNIELAGGY